MSKTLIYKQSISSKTEQTAGQLNFSTTSAITATSSSTATQQPFTEQTQMTTQISPDRTANELPTEDETIDATTQRTTPCPYSRAWGPFNPDTWYRDDPTVYIPFNDQDCIDFQGSTFVAGMVSWHLN